MEILIAIVVWFYLVFLVVRLSWRDTFPIASLSDLIPFSEPTAFRSWDGSITYTDGRPPYPPKFQRDYDAKHGVGAWDAKGEEMREASRATWEGLADLYRHPPS